MPTTISPYMRQVGPRGKSSDDEAALRMTKMTNSHVGMSRQVLIIREKTHECQSH